jgi:hypothetical protein
MGFVSLVTNSRRDRSTPVLAVSIHSREWVTRESAETHGPARARREGGHRRFSRESEPAKEANRLVLGEAARELAAHFQEASSWTALPEIRPAERKWGSRVAQ